MLAQGEANEVYDATTGQVLKRQLVVAARKEEMTYFQSKNVWVKMQREEALKMTGKQPITVKWVDVFKGDDENPNHRSRLVAREIGRKGEESIFAPTPPLEALRTVLSLAATKNTWNAKVDSDLKSFYTATDKDEERIQVSMIESVFQCAHKR